MEHHTLLLVCFKIKYLLIIKNQRTNEGQEQEQEQE